jgi:hypothetical protein
MDIGRIERIIDIEPVIMPVPGVLSDLPSTPGVIPSPPDPRPVREPART